MPPKRIAFFKDGLFSHTNTSVGKFLVEQFPEFEVEFIDVPQETFLRRKLIILRNLFSIFRWHGPRGLASRAAIEQRFYQTPFLFHHLQRWAQQRLREPQNNYAFTFQTQSIFDASCPALPHFVYTDHTHLANTYYPGFDKRNLHPSVWVQLEKLIYSRATRTFTMSNHVVRSIVEHYGVNPDRVRCVLAGCNTAIQPTPLANQNYTNKHILFVGVDWSRKGGPELIAAFREVLKVHPDARLTIVGCSPNISVPNCDIVGLVPVHQVASFFPRASVFCLPSKLEPFGIVCLEAFMHKIPVVASHIGALPDFITDGESGRLIDPTNVTQFAAALTELISNPEKCQRFGEAGYAKIKDSYTWDAVGIRIKDEIQAALKA